MRNRPRKAAYTARFGAAKRWRRSAGQIASPVDKFLRFVGRTGKRVRAVAFLLVEIVTVGSLLAASVLLEGSTIARMKAIEFPAERLQPFGDPAPLNQAQPPSAGPSQEPLRQPRRLDLSCAGCQVWRISTSSAFTRYANEQAKRLL
jgi:hypothetical protein